MFCKNCGKEIDDKAAVCIYCGHAVNENATNKNYNEPKTGVGVACAFFLGIIGLIIGLCIYPENTVARQTFMKAWGTTFAICAVVAILIYGIAACATAGLISSYY